MRKMLLAASALGATLGLMASGPADAQTPLIGPVACDRACLQGMVDAYLDAVVPQKPSVSPSCWPSSV